MANKKHIRLNSARDVHKLLPKLINERRRGQVDTTECRDIGYLAKILLDSIEAGELEDRKENLEKPQELDVMTFPQHSIEDERIIIRHYQEEHKRTLALLKTREIEDKAKGVKLIPADKEN